MVSHKHRCIFVHLPKTGGTSISKKLGLFSVSSRGVQDHRPIVDIEPLSIAHLRRKCYRQDGLYRYARRQLGNLRKGRRRLSRQDFESYYKFAFVRNSWARVASWYKGVMRDDVIRKGLGVPSDCSLRDFITVHGGQFHLNPQLYWLRNARGQMAMDFIGRFERLQQDFDHVCHTLGIEDSQLPTELMFGGGGGSAYSTLYDDGTREIVARRYREEIEMFGFEFGQ